MNYSNPKKLYPNIFRFKSARYVYRGLTMRIQRSNDTNLPLTWLY